MSIYFGRMGRQSKTLSHLLLTLELKGSAEIVVFLLVFFDFHLAEAHVVLFFLDDWLQLGQDDLLKSYLLVVDLLQYLDLGTAFLQILFDLFLQLL